MRTVLKVLVAAALTASTALAQECPAQGGTATLAQWSEPGNLNPLIFPTTYDRNIEELVFARLLRPTSELAYEPDLAEGWEFSDDQRSLTFTLREGLAWPDGEPLTTNDVLFTLSALADAEYDGGGYSDISIIEGAEAFHDGDADTVSGIEIVDERKVIITTSEPFAPVLANLANVFILPEHIYGAVPVANWQRDASNRNPVGAGPFVFKEWRSGELIELTPNENYHAGAPCLDRLIVRFGDQDTMLAAFLAGEVDMTRVPLGSIPSVEGRDGVSIKVVDSLSFQYLGFNLHNEILAELPVRQAIAAAINRQAIVDGLLRGYGRTLDTILPTNHWSYPEDVEPIVYDVEAARAILDEAGWELRQGVRARGDDRLAFTIYVPTGDQVRERSAPIIQANLKQVGIDVSLQTMDFATLVTHLLPRDAQGTPRGVTADDFDMFLLGFGVERDPDEYYSYFTEGGLPPNGYNFSGYVAQAAEDALNEGRVVLDVAERSEPYQAFGRLAREELPWVPLYQAQEIYANNARLHGFAPDVRGVNPNATGWWVDP